LVDRWEMTIRHLAPREARRAIGNPFLQPRRLFCERYIAGTDSQGEPCYWNTSDLGMVARAAGQFVQLVDTRALVAMIVAPERIVRVSDEGEVRHIDPRTDQVWLGHSTEGIQQRYLKGLEAVFFERRA
jgi:hypothetical protein